MSILEAFKVSVYKNIYVNVLSKKKKVFVTFFLGGGAELVFICI